LIYYAHTADDAAGNRLPESDWQPLRTHLENVAKLAAEFGAPFGASAEAQLAGLLHDPGKYRDEFQSYNILLQQGAVIENEQKKSIKAAVESLPK
jgi:CRISPR-associated endonuclease/helicase Cas3